MDTFCSTSVDPVSQSLKAVLPEIIYQLTNLHSAINGNQNTSMDILCYNLFLINDNVVTMKNEVAHTTPVSDTHFQVFLKVRKWF